ncbi:hypothetical protein J6590_050264 [Homalodisca vitripennis]|nr:hypothetical protein J6590_050264 [Homalodisca vitripennis]
MKRENLATLSNVRRHSWVIDSPGSNPALTTAISLSFILLSKSSHTAVTQGKFNHLQQHTLVSVITVKLVFGKSG